MSMLQSGKRIPSCYSSDRNSPRVRRLAEGDQISGVPGSFTNESKAEWNETWLGEVDETGH